MTKTYTSSKINTQNDLLMNHLQEFYKNKDHLQKMMNIINGESNISLRILDWFVTNYAKKYYTVYDLTFGDDTVRFKVYNDYKLKLKAYSKKRFDPFCRWERITIPFDNDNYIETTIGQLNFFKWAIEQKILDYITEDYDQIERDMNERNSISRRKQSFEKDENVNITIVNDNGKTRKKREELSISACKCIKKENVKIIVKF
jgi:hypothetical protein